MNSLPANSPQWLTNKILDMGGCISFYEFMNIALNDPNNGYYGSGKAKIGKDGDFVTSPSLSNDFAALLGIQIEDWLIQIDKSLMSKKKLCIFEFGAGNACLLGGIMDYFLSENSNILKNISFKICEINIGMRELQRRNLKKYLQQGIDINWIDINDVDNGCINGIIIAHELLDAFPVERIQYKNGNLYRQGVELNKKHKTLHLKNMPLTEKIKKFIHEIKDELGIVLPPKDAPEEWTTELNINNLNWLKNISRKIDNGILLVIDYAIEAKKYYSPQKNNGTILAYKNQKAFKEILNCPGDYDLTSHICIDILNYQAKLAGFEVIGLVKQGEALLLLGLAQRLFEIQKNFKDNLALALVKREAILRLVDPICLGDFKWFIFKKFNDTKFSIMTKCIN